MNKPFIKEFIEPEEISGRSYWFFFQRDRLLVSLREDGSCDVPLIDDPAELEMTPIRKQYLGTYENRCCYCH